eukprot:9087587-Heterocapsa_arctica.AAC.1
MRVVFAEPNAIGRNAHGFVPGENGRAVGVHTVCSHVQGNGGFCGCRIHVRRFVGAVFGLWQRQDSAFPDATWLVFSSSSQVCVAGFVGRVSGRLPSGTLPPSMDRGFLYA